MVDRNARDRVAELIRHLISGQLTNFEYEKQLPRSGDPAIHEICGDVWLLYDDLHEHRLIGKYKVNPRERNDLACCLLFLKTDLPYEWPAMPGWAQLFFMLVNICSLGVVGFFSRRWFKSRGPFEVWPFFRREDFENARKNPQYLSGAA